MSKYARKKQKRQRQNNEYKNQSYQSQECSSIHPPIQKLEWAIQVCKLNLCRWASWSNFTLKVELCKFSGIPCGGAMDPYPSGEMNPPKRTFFSFILLSQQVTFRAYYIPTLSGVIEFPTKLVSLQLENQVLLRSLMLKYVVPIVGKGRSFLTFQYSIPFIKCCESSHAIDMFGLSPKGFRKTSCVVQNTFSLLLQKHLFTKTN